MSTALSSAIDRRTYQQHVTFLLERLEEERRRLYRLKAGGARRAGMRDLKDDLEATRRSLLAAVGASLGA